MKKEIIRLFAGVYLEAANTTGYYYLYDGENENEGKQHLTATAIRTAQERGYNLIWVSYVRREGLRALFSKPTKEVKGNGGAKNGKSNKKN